MPHPVFDLAPDARELSGLAFSCLPGCGWCCTHPPEVDAAEEARLRAKRPNVRIGFDGERSYLRLQGGCGACQFLDTARRCSVYEDRPGHCRWFPFHVHFGRRVEVVVNRSCPGVVASAGGSLVAEARASLASADAATVARHVEESREAHDAFRANCEEAGAWGDVDAAAREALALGPRLFTRRGLEDLTGATASDLLASALAAFEHGDPTKRPYLVDPDLRWFVFHRRATRVGASELSAAGRLDVRQVVPIASWEDPAPGLAEALFPHVVELLSRESFAGGVFDRVDEEEYAVGVEEAAREEAASVACDLVLRARIVDALRKTDDAPSRAREARRFYDSDFLDRPTIGAWL